MIDVGVFYNDVILVGNCDMLFIYECVFVNK